MNKDSHERMVEAMKKMIKKYEDTPIYGDGEYYSGVEAGRDAVIEDIIEIIYGDEES